MTRFGTDIFPDQLRDGAGQHEAGDRTAHDVEKRVHDAGAGGGFDWRAEGTAQRAGSWSTAAAYLRSRKTIRQVSIQTLQGLFSTGYLLRTVLHILPNTRTECFILTGRDEEVVYTKFKTVLGYRVY